MEYTDEKHAWMSRAEQFVNYFERLANKDGEAAKDWVLGYFMAKHWVRLLDDSEIDLDEAKLFVRALEAELSQQGSGWFDLFLQVNGWLAEIEETSNGKGRH